MAYQFDFSAARRILRCRFEGHLNDASLKEFYRIGEKYVAWSSPHAGIVDFTNVSELKVTERAVVELANSEPLILDPDKPRFLVAPTPLLFEMARIFQMVGESTRPNLHIVLNPEEAWRFMRIEEPRFEPIIPI